MSGERYRCKDTGVIKHERPRYRWKNNVIMNSREYVTGMRTDSSGIGHKSVAAPVSNTKYRRSAYGGVCLDQLKELSACPSLLVGFQQKLAYLRVETVLGKQSVKNSVLCGTKTMSLGERPPYLSEDRSEDGGSAIRRNVSD